MRLSEQHITSPGAAIRRRRMNDLFYPPRMHCDSPKRPVATNDVESDTFMRSTAYRHQISDVFCHPEPAHGRPLEEPEMLLRTTQQRMSELFYRPPSSARGNSQKIQVSRACKPPPDTSKKSQQRMSELFFQPPTRTRSESKPYRERPPSLTRWISLPLNDSVTRAREPSPYTKPQRRMSDLFYQPPTRTQSCFEWPPSLTKSASLPLNDSRLAASGTQDARHDGGQSRLYQAEQKDLAERLERLNSLSVVIERKLQEQKDRKMQEQKERKTLRLICLLTSEAMHRDETI